MKLLTFGETCDLLRISRTTLQRFIERGTVPAVKLGRQWRVPEEVLHRRLEPPVGGNTHG